MAQQGSVTYWIDLLKAGDAAAAQHIWDRFFARLVHLARVHLRGLSRGPADEEDIALSAFNRFCLAVRRGQFPKLEDRDDLWQLLTLLAEYKARDHRRREGRQKRGRGQVHDEAWFQKGNGPRASGAGLAALASQEPSPEFAALLADECGSLLLRLKDDGLKAVAVARLEGYTNAEVATKLGCSIRSIERKLNLIRNIWERSAGDD